MTKNKACQILLEPWITEKSTGLHEQDRSVFLVPIDSTKPEIKAAVELLFPVNVIGISTLITKPKVKRFRGRKGLRRRTKKAIVRLQAGQKLDFNQAIG